MKAIWHFWYQSIGIQKFICVIPFKLFTHQFYIELWAGRKMNILVVCFSFTFFLPFEGEWYMQWSKGLAKGKTGRGHPEGHTLDSQLWIRRPGCLGIATNFLKSSLDIEVTSQNYRTRIKVPLLLSSETFISSPFLLQRYFWLFIYLLWTIPLWIAF